MYNIEQVIGLDSHSNNIKILQDVQSVIKPSRSIFLFFSVKLCIYAYQHCVNFHRCLLIKYLRTYFFGRMTLLLGPPGSGKTTLLQAIAGKLDQTLKVFCFFPVKEMICRTLQGIEFNKTIYILIMSYQHSYFL